MGCGSISLANKGGRAVSLPLVKLDMRAARYPGQSHKDEGWNHSLLACRGIGILPMISMGN
jgi:hypothetical protein